MEEKDLNTWSYSYNICRNDMFVVRYKGLRLVPSKTASRELFKYGFMLEDCKRFLEEGCAAPRKRHKNTIEKWFHRGNKTINIVLARSFNYMYDEDVFLIIHVGVFSR